MVKLIKEAATATDNFLPKPTINRFIVGLGKKLSVAVAASFMSLTISLPGVQAAENPQLKENLTNFVPKHSLVQSELPSVSDKAIKQYVFFKLRILSGLNTRKTDG